MKDEEKIKKLKELAIARECALEYDYCPNSSEIDDILNDETGLDSGDFVTLSRDYFSKILDDNRGRRPDEIENHICRIIKSL